MRKSSRLWPILAAIGNRIKIPGTDYGFGFLVEIQDRYNADVDHQEIVDVLHAMLKYDKEIFQLLKKHNKEVKKDEICELAMEVAEKFYLNRVADKYLYADFKGIEQMEKLVPLKLDEVFVNLKVRREETTEDRQEKEMEMALRLERAESGEQEKMESLLAERDAERLQMFKRDGEAVSLDRMLSKPGGVVLLGGPGSGKTTLVKRLARSCALGEQIMKERYPELRTGFPIVMPIAEFEAQNNGQDMYLYLCTRMNQEGGQALEMAFMDNWAAGSCLVLLDGLDEVAKTENRIACSRAVGEFFRQLNGNRALVTSRPVGYSICRLNVPTEHWHLQPFEREDIEQFARNWRLAYEKTVKPESPDLEAAEKEAKELIEEIQSNDKVESLAKNPLMLTIIALIKHQNMVLPQRRVNLYEIALNTLMRSWNKARTLAAIKAGQKEDEIGLEEAKKVWAAVAHWMHREKSTGTCHRQELLDYLVELLMELGQKSDLEATRIAESYLTIAADKAGLLEERGAGVYAFMHQTFQEYLAARHLFLAKPRKKAIDRILKVAQDPRWHEVVRLSAGFIGVIQEDDETVTELTENILKDDTNPLEPYLCNSLRLAASCIADDVRVDAEVTDKVVAAIIERLNTFTYTSVKTSLIESLQCTSP
ncbi:MAG: NACHT domain-containing protein [Planctomycetota bacterium]